MSHLQRLGRTFATDATFGDLGQELIRQGSNYATRRLVKMADKGTKNVAKKIKNELKQRIKETYLKKKQMPPTKAGPSGSYSTVNSQASRASMKKTGKLKNIKKGKKVKVSSKLREKIKEVMKSASYSGQYNALSQGTIGVYNVGAAQSSRAIFQFADNIFAGCDDINVVACVPQYTDGSQSSWVYWGGMVQKDTSTDAAAFQHAFEHFSPLQFLDAASKMWNGKYGSTGPGSWYKHSTDNIQLDVRRSNGGQGNPTLGSAYQVGPLKLNIVNSHVKYKLRNNSQRSYTIEIFHCTPKLKFPGITALGDLYQSVLVELQGVDNTALPITAINENKLATLMSEGTTSSGSTNTEVNRVLSHPMFDPKDSIQFKSRWSYQKIVIRLSPGEICEHSIQGPKNTLLDFSKIVHQKFADDITIGRSEIPTWVKGFSASCFMRVLPDMTSSSDLVAETATFRNTYNASGNYTVAQNLSHAPGRKVVLPISVEMQHSYNIKCPETNGFVQQAITAGQAQHLNLKRPVKRFDTFATNLNNYQTVNEENPNSAVPAGLYN